MLSGGKRLFIVPQNRAIGLAQSTPPGLMWRAGVKGMVPMAAVIGLLLTPSRYLAAKVAGGVVLATIANAARQVAVATKKRQAPEALLELLREKGAGVVMREEVSGYWKVRLQLNSVPARELPFL